MPSGAKRRKAAKKKKETKPTSPTSSQPGNDDSKLSPDEKESDSGEVSSPTATSITTATNTLEESQQPHHHPPSKEEEEEEDQIEETPKEEKQVKIESSTIVSIERQEEDIRQSSNEGLKVPDVLSDEQVVTKDRMMEGESKTILIESGSGSGSDTESQRVEEQISKLDESKVEEVATSHTPVQMVPNSEPLQIIQSSEVYDEVEQVFWPPEEASQVTEESQAEKVENLNGTGLPSTDSNGKVLSPLNDLGVETSNGIEQLRDSHDQPASIFVESVKESHNNSGNFSPIDTDIESKGVEEKEDDEVEKSRKLDQDASSFAAVQIVPNVEMQVGSASETYGEVDKAVSLSEEASQFMEETAAKKVEKLGEIGLPSIDNKDKILPPSDNPGVETSNEIKQSKESQAPQSIHNQIQQREANPPNVRPASWKNCCGLFDVLMGSNRS